MYLLGEKALLLPLLLPLLPSHPLFPLRVIEFLHYYVYDVSLLLLAGVQVPAGAAVPQVLYDGLPAIQEPDELVPRGRSVDLQEAYYAALLQVMLTLVQHVAVIDFAVLHVFHAFQL